MTLLSASGLTLVSPLHLSLSHRTPQISEIKSLSTGVKSYVGVLEFTAPDCEYPSLPSLPLSLFPPIRLSLFISAVVVMPHGDSLLKSLYILL